MRLDRLAILRVGRQLGERASTQVGELREGWYVVGRRCRQMDGRVRRCVGGRRRGH